MIGGNKQQWTVNGKQSMTNMSDVQQYVTGDGRRIYGFRVQAFAGLVANIYVIDDGARLILVDTGSGLAQSNQGLVDGFAALQREMGVAWQMADIDQILITHGHIDHFGGLPFVRQQTDAPVGVHILDRRVLSSYEERVMVASRRLETFLVGAGVPEKYLGQLMQVYLFAKPFYHSTPVQFLLEPSRPVFDIDIYHVPGHCPGQVCLRLGDVLLTADHVLARTTPHQAPESITLNTGLGHYLDSLDKIAQVPGIRLALGGHEAPMPDLYGRIGAIQQAHQERLDKILAICAGMPQSIAEISRALFGRVESYHVLLALEETGAHVEYLYQRGELVATNLAEIEQTQNPVIRYQRV